MSGVLFEDIFEVGKLNPDGKKFDRVNRLECKGVTYDMDLLLDTNCDIYPVKEAERLTFVLASTLDLSGKPDDGTYKPLGDEVSLADKYEYVMHGRVYRFEHQKDTKVFASFGGLLMRLTGDQRHVANIEVDSRVFCLLRRNV
ncbi:unnamed protein product [Pylaiella littoralis]